MTWTLKFLRLIHISHKFSESLCTTDRSNECCFFPPPFFRLQQALLLQEQAKFHVCLWALNSRVYSKLAPAYGLAIAERRVGRTSSCSADEDGEDV